MPKPRDGPALFEIMRRIEPDGSDARAKESPTVPESETAPPPTAPQPRALHRPGGGGRSPDGGGSDVSAEAPRFEVAGGRVRFALTSRATAVAIFGLGLLLVVAYVAGLAIGRQRGKNDGYEAGRASVQASAVDEIQEARAKRPVEGLFDGLGISPVRSAPAGKAVPAAVPKTMTRPPRSDVAWVRGYTYVVVQDFKADALADVERARRYLLDHEVETVVLELKGDWRYRLTTAQGFNRDDPVQRGLADDFLAELRRLGQAYFDAGGRYRLEGYFKKLTTETW